MRAFIGTRLNDCNHKILEVQDFLKSEDPNANYTRFENLHLTLVFLGEVNNKEIGVLKKILDNIDRSAFVITTRKLMIMRDKAVLEIEPHNHLNALYDELTDELQKNGFLSERRKYYPHITLSRKTRLNLEKEIVMSSNVDEIILFSSERIANLLTYTPMHIKRLEDKINRTINNDK